MSWLHLVRRARSLTDLRNLGFEEAFHTSLRLDPGTPSPKAAVPARVIRQDRQLYHVAASAGEFPARLSGRLMYASADSGTRPVVGDWGAVESGAPSSTALIVGCAERRSVLSRKVAGAVTRQQVLAANMDLVLVVSSLNQELNLRRLERYLTSLGKGGAQPVLVLNKSDLVAEALAVAREVESSAPGVAVHVVSAQTGAGVEALRELLRPHRTAALVGSSGVGKSTLVNQMLGREQQRTGAIRDDDGKGRHTTTRRELLQIPGGGILIDTPGLREIQLWEGEDALDGVFPELAAFASDCRFRDCRHHEEPGCAVLQAVAEGHIDGDRYASWRKLEQELGYLESRKDQVQRQDRKRRDKQFSRMAREACRRKRNR